MVLFIFVNAEDCPSDIKSKTASISIGFNYTGNSALNGPQDDAKFFAKDVGASLSDDPQLMTDTYLNGRGKEIFLNHLKKMVKGKDPIVFAYSGHGTNENGTWSMVLLGYENCKTGAPEHIERCVQQFLVSDTELQNVFGNKKVLMFNDSCFSGGGKFGPNVTHVSSSMSDQTSLDLINKKRDNEMAWYEKLFSATPHNGAFTQRIQNQFGECAWDSNGDGHMNALELTQRYAVYKYGVTSKKRKPQPKTMDALSGISGARVYKDGKAPPVRQYMSIYNSQPWIKCMDLGANTCTKVKAGATDANKNIEK